MKKALFITVLIFYYPFFNCASAQVKILFDCTKAETAGNADWVIDADLHNMDWLPNAMVGTGNESNAQHLPSPAQTSVTSSTAETYWDGALSAWAIGLVKSGYWVESLPYNGHITYNDGSNSQDLSNYKVFVIDEPNIRFTANEKSALIQFIQNGGGLFMISDHAGSDRNGDGWDSQSIWNDFMSTYNNPFGITYDSADFSQTTSNIPNLPGDSLLHGPYGDVTEMQYANGASMTLNPDKNNSVKGIIYKTGASFGNNEVMMAYARYGNGKIVALGDSSPTDDGTGDPNDILYSGWAQDANGNHKKVIMNATIWLAAISDTLTLVDNLAESNISVYPNPSTGEFVFKIGGNPLPGNIQLYDIAGKVILQSNPVFLNQNIATLDLKNLTDGLYIAVISIGETTIRKKLIKSN